MDLWEILPDYLDPSKYESGEIHLSFEIMDKQIFYKF